MSFATVLLSCTFLLSSPPPATYHGVVVDAVTRKPLPSASVQRLDSPGAQITDGNGSFTFTLGTEAALHLRITSLGYAPADLTRPIAAAGADTIRLSPTLEALPGVTVRPRQEVTIQPFAKSPRPANSYFLIPSVQIASQLPALPNGATGTLSALQLQLKPSPIRTGGLRVQLLAVPEAAGEVAGPSGKPLLAKPIEITAAQLAAAPKGAFVLDLSEYNLPMPSTGIFVVLEALGVTPEQKFVSATIPIKGHSALVVTGTDPAKSETYEVTKLNDYPQIQFAETSDESRTWLLGSNGRGWRLAKPAPGDYRTKNTMVSLVVLPD